MNTFLKSAFAGVVAIALPAMASAQACPSYANPGYGLTYTAETAYMPQATSVVAGGDLNLSACGSVPGNGYVASSPDFSVQYNDLGMGRALEFRVVAECDAVLLINGANGQWYFNDDSNGSDPALRIGGASSGRYDVWVGTFGSSLCGAQLIVETF